MNINSRSTGSIHGLRHQKGMGLLDVVLGVVIFAVGMLALASLQGNLSRSSADSNANTVAVNLAERIIEEFRSFEQIPSEVDKVAYQDIVTATRIFTIGGIDYTVLATVEDWFFMPDREGITNDIGDLPADWNTSVSDYKRVTLDVSWAGSEFQISEGVTTTDRLGSGVFSITSVIPSAPVLGAAKIASDDNGAMGGPPVIYTPGLKPNIVAIQVDNSKFKESQTPLPDVVIKDEVVETWFDVVTYNTSETNTFIRREEFVVVSCNCTLRMPSSEEGTGFLPTTWNGVTYSEGEWEKKPYGESANSRQSKYCETCCRDHHDLSTKTGSDYVYDPWRDWTSKGGAHKHYAPNSSAGWDEVTSDGADYLEACRMVRKDGFMRVAQDFRQEGFNATRQEYFKDGSNVDAYSVYVTSGVSSLYLSGTPIGAPSPSLPGGTDVDAVPLPTTESDDPDPTSDQQVSRGIYLDHITAELEANIKCVRGIITGCDMPPNVSNYLEILPFYEIQTTWLSWWDDNVEGYPVFVTNQKLEDDNEHSRGKAFLRGSGDMVIADTDIHRGNVGLTSTDPIDPFYYDTIAQANADLYICPNGCGGGGTSPTYDAGLSGTITSTTNVKASNVIFTGSTGVICTSDAGTYDCKFNIAETPVPTFKISGYSNNKDIYICDSSGIYDSESIQYPEETTFYMTGVDAMVSGINLIIQYESCALPL